MEPTQSTNQQEREGQRRIRFTNDSDNDLTFVNYDASGRGGFRYRQEARLHNAQRLIHRRGGRDEDMPTTLAGRLIPQEQHHPRSATPSNSTLINPLSTYARDPFGQALTASSQTIERTWHLTFARFFGLPHLDRVPQGFPNPSTIFLKVAKESQDLYRSIVLQVVTTAEAETGTENSGEALFHNQALILHDFRKLAEIYGAPNSPLSSKQFQHVFATAFSFSGRGFDKESGYNAVVLMNSVFMSVKQHQTMIQTPISEWFRMLMPRPGLNFDRTESFQREMLRKVELTIKFMDRTQSDLHNPYPDHISRYLRPSTAIFRLITTPLPDNISNEPYVGFYLICRHRLLSMMLRHLQRLSEEALRENEEILQKYELLASVCLQCPSPQCIALFLWCQISTAEATGLNQDQEEPLFSWSMKDLLFLHNLNFAEHMAFWLTHKGQPNATALVAAIDFEALHQQMKDHYSPSK